MDGFKPVESVQYCDNQYTYSGSVDEYGSGENIQNFQMFKEYIASACSKVDILGDSPTLTERSTSSVKAVYVSDGNACGYLYLDDGAEFWVQPVLTLNYGVYEIYAPQGSEGGYASIRIECSQQYGDEPEGVYYVGAMNVTIASDAGSISSTDSDRKYDYDHTSHHSEVYFNFSALDYSFSQIEEILNGNNVRFIFNIEKSPEEIGAQGEMIESTYNLDDKEIAAMRFYLELYKNMPYAKYE